MIKCQQCRDKDVELLTRWERFKAWSFEKINHIFFADDFDDLKQQKYTQGFSDGTIDGGKWERSKMEREQLLYTTEKKPLTEDEIETKLSELLTGVDFNDVISTDKAKGIVYLGKDRANPARLNNLKAEAEFLAQSDLWKLLNETPKELAQKEMFVHADSIEGMRKGRAVIFLMSQQNNIIELLKGVTVVDKQ